MIWDILVCTIPHRDASLRELLAVLDPQMAGGQARVILYRDNLEKGYGDKCQALLAAADADYVSFIDDDDLVVPGFVPLILAVLLSEPDYVGFRVRYTVDGVEQRPVVHSLRYPGWNQVDYLAPGELLYRDITHLNPIRRELAMLGRWEEPGWQADFRWASQVRASGRAVNEAFINLPLYCKQDHRAGDFRSGPRQPVAAEDIPSLPSYPWLKVL